MKPPTPTSWLQRIWLLILMVGPGIFCIGYTIGTGSVTSMSRAGSEYGTSLLWVLAFSCLFSWVLIEAYGRYAVVTGRTAINSFRTEFPFGKIFAIVVMFGIIAGQWTVFSGLIALTSTVVYEGVRLLVPGLGPVSYGAVLLIAVLILIFMYGVVWFGSYSLFEKILVVFVTILGLSFFITAVIVLPAPTEIIAGFVPSIPDVDGAYIMVAAFVGTTMAAPVFIVRPILVKTKGWTLKDYKIQQRDAFFCALLMFLVSGSIMLCAAGVLYGEGRVVTHVLDMARSLEPVLGRFAVFLFIMGIVSAGLSSTLPVLMVASLLLSDYKNGKMETRSPSFRILAAIAAMAAMTIPILGYNPIVAQITTQVAQVFVLPLVVLGIIILVNRPNMQQYRAGWLLNTGLAAAMIFSFVMSYIAVAGLRQLLGAVGG